MPNHLATSPADVARRLRRLATDRIALRRAGGAGPDPLPAPGEADPALPRTTVEATIRPAGRGRYRRLAWGPGEPHRLRAGGLAVSPERVRTRRSLLYVAQHTDTHICDAQSPARLEGGEAFGWANPGTDGGHRPQEVLTTQVLDRLVAATNAVAESPVTGAPMAWCIQTGDNTDSRTRAELAWWLGVLEGRPITPGTGAPGRYEGIQRSGGRGAWHPDDPRRDVYGRAGYPRLPGVLDAAVRSFEPVGLDVPWLAVFGNHDAIFAGTFGPVPGPRLDRLEPMLVGAAAKPAGALGLVRAIAHARLFGPDPARWERWAERFPLGIRQVVADPDRRSPVATAEYLAALLDPETRVGPVGHGFTAAHLDRGATWWSRPEGELIQVIGLDTCNHRSGDSGSIGPRQWAWLEEELVRHHRRWRTTTGEWAAGDGPDRLVVLASHHNSWTMHNRNDDPADPGPRKGGRDLLALLARFPNVVLWMNGHSHEHRIIHHRGSEPGTGCWEVDTASAIDFSQQARTFELFDNGDGTLSILVTVLDHASPPGAPHHAHGRWTVSELASLSRELAVNDARWIDPLLLLGGVEDRNVELVLRAPFPLAG